MNPKDNYSIKPKLHRMKTLYEVYVHQLLKENPDYITRFNLSRNIKHFGVYKKVSESHQSKMWLGSASHKIWVIEIINFDRWRAMLVETMKEVITFVTNGEEFILGHNMGKVAPRRVERDYSNLQVNWFETNKLPKRLDESGKLVPERFIYHEGDYVRVGWKKENRVTNERVYEFKPSKGKKGFATHFSKANMNNKLLKFSYDYFPYIIDPDDNS